MHPGKAKTPTDGSLADNERGGNRIPARASLRKFLIAGSVAVLAQSGALLLLAGVVRRRRRNEQVIRRLMRRITQVREQELQHVARELHDNIGQRLTLLSIRLGSLQSHRLSDTADIAELAELQQEVDALISEIHGLSHGMHSSKLEHLGLQDALAEMCRNISQHHSLSVRLQCNGIPGGESPELSLCFYRIAQEALNNVIKHSGATRGEVLLTRTADRLKMRVKDNGIGFDTKRATTGLGLASIEERILSVQGSVSVISRVHEGTLLVVDAPLRQRDSSIRDSFPDKRSGNEDASQSAQSLNRGEFQHSGA